jgi:hypothetical protein
MNRAALDTSTLLRIALLLVVILLALMVLEALLEFTSWLLFGVLPWVVGLAVVVIVVLWLIDRL